MLIIRVDTLYGIGMQHVSSHTTGPQSNMSSSTR